MMVVCPTALLEAQAGGGSPDASRSGDTSARHERPKRRAATKKYDLDLTQPAPLDPPGGKGEDDFAGPLNFEGDGGEAQADPADAVGFGNTPTAAAPSGDSADAAGFGSGTSDAVGFGDADFTPNAASSSVLTAPASDPIKLGATLRLQIASRTSPLQLAKARQLLGVRLEARHSFFDALSVRLYAAAHSEADFHILANQADYDSATFDTYAWQLGPREVYVALEWSAFELRVGEQIINLGQADMLSVLDVFNPRDLREPLITESEDLRLPVLTTRLGVTLDRIRVEVMVVHEPYFGLRAPPLGEFSPLRKLILDDPTLGPALEDRTLSNRDVPGHHLVDVDATQVHARLTWTGPGVDLSFLVSDLLDPFGVPSLPPASAFDAKSIDLPIAHPRYLLFGQGGAWTLGPCILRWELAYEHDRPWTVTQTDTDLMLWSIARMSALRGVIGLTYAPSTTTQAMLEISQAYLFVNPPAGTTLLFPAEAPQLALRINQTFLSERLTLAGLAYFIGVSPFNAWAARVDIRYALTDDIEAAIGFTTYQPTNRFGVFYGLRGHDRLMFSIRWNVSN